MRQLQSNISKRNAAPGVVTLERRETNAIVDGSLVGVFGGDINPQAAFRTTDVEREDASRSSGRC
jgi:hypothetical protein